MWASGIVAVMVLMECLEVGLTTLSKTAMNRGMSDFVFVVYSNALAFLFLLLSSFIFHRLRPCPPLTPYIVYRIFLFALLSCCIQIFIYVGIGYSSPTLASAMNSLTPGLTFILATITRIEKLELTAESSQAKSIGTIISVAGALIVTLYKGPQIMFSRASYEVVSVVPSSPQSNWIVGGSLLAAATFLTALLFIVQAGILKDYPSELMVTLIACFFVTIQSAIVALIAERNNPSAWNLRPGVELVTLGYSAVLLVTIRSVVHAWALHQKGPVFVIMFKPLGMIIAVVMGVAILGDKLYAGRIIGAAAIALGFYFVMWGKAQEIKLIDGSEISGLGPSTDKLPLMQNMTMDV